MKTVNMKPFYFGIGTLLFVVWVLSMVFFLPLGLAELALLFVS